MIVDVVDCQRCGRPKAVGIVFDAPPRLPAVEVCADCLRTQVLRWLEDEHLPYGKGVLYPFQIARCPRCDSADHYDPEGCPGPQSKPLASS